MYLGHTAGVLLKSGQGVVAVGTIRLPHHVSSAGVVRRQVGADLGAHGIAPKLAGDVALVLSELVANSVRHASPLAGGELEVSWDMTARGIELRVTDGGSAAAPELRAVGVDDVSGRGLTIVAKLAAAWGVESTALGTTVWALVTGGRRRNGERIRLA